MLTGFIIGMLTMYFLINLYFASIYINNSPSELPQYRQISIMGFVLDLFVGIWVRGIMYKLETLTKWTVIMNVDSQKKEKVDGE